MALSDSCYETLNKLRRDFLNHIDGGYDDQDLGLLMDSMYGLARFCILQDNCDRPSPAFIEHATHRVVVETMIQDVNENLIDVLCNRLARIAEYNSCLRQCLKDLIEGAQSKHRLFDAMADPEMYVRLMKLSTHMKL